MVAMASGQWQLEQPWRHCFGTLSPAEGRSPSAEHISSWNSRPYQDDRGVL